MTITEKSSESTRARTSLPAILFVENNPDDFIIARDQLTDLKLRNPLDRVVTVPEMFCYLRGEGTYADRIEFPMPALIVIDMELPQTGALQAQAMLRSSLKFRTIPIIVISSVDRITMLKTAVDMGANAYLTKPFDPVKFHNTALELRLPFEFDT